MKIAIESRNARCAKLAEQLIACGHEVVTDAAQAEVVVKDVCGCKDAKLLNKAAWLLVDAHFITAESMQRELRVSMNETYRIMDKLVEMGYLSPYAGANNRFGKIRAAECEAVFGPREA